MADEGFGHLLRGVLALLVGVRELGPECAESQRSTFLDRYRLCANGVPVLFRTVLCVVVVCV